MGTPRTRRSASLRGRGRERYLPSSPTRSEGHALSEPWSQITRTSPRTQTAPWNGPGRDGARPSVGVVANGTCRHRGRDRRATLCRGLGRKSHERLLERKRPPGLPSGRDRTRPSVGVVANGTCRHRGRDRRATLCRGLGRKSRERLPERKQPPGMAPDATERVPPWAWSRTVPAVIADAIGGPRSVVASVANHTNVSSNANDRPDCPPDATERVPPWAWSRTVPAVIADAIGGPRSVVASVANHANVSSNANSPLEWPRTRRSASLSVAVDEGDRRWR
ncbi:MAG: hypothetical protein KatS3mg076_0915 [Candidatus Binatia bacterium]|nr:MAG: hypothetical protein KatS3mg076_0915 [Candidatus Binatia bacterium]